MKDFDTQHKKIMAMLDAMTKRSAKYQKEANERQRQADERQRQADERQRQADERHQKLQKSTDKTNKIFGGYTNNEAERLEEEFYEGLCDTMEVNGVHLDELRQREKSKYEYDLVGINGKAVFVGEIKQKLLPKDVEKFAKERLVYYAENFPHIAKKRKVFGMVGGGTITAGAVRMAEKYGLFVLRLKNKKLIVENAESARPVN